MTGNASIAVAEPRAGRNVLRAIIVLGALVTLLGGTGIFAVFNDRATAGTDSVTSGSRPRAADLKIAAGFFDPTGGTPAVDCDSDHDGVLFNGDSDGTTTAQFTVSGAQPGSNLGTAYICLLNAGSAPLDVTSSAIDLADLDVDCTGDESVAGDATCGPAPAGLPQNPGELSPLLFVNMDRVECEAQAGGLVIVNDNSPLSLDQFDSVMLAQAGATTAALQPNEVMCVQISLTYPTPASETEAQIAQSDQATWRFAFDGTAN